jgi:hypothetical protein
MDRTLRAALVAAVIAFASIAGLGVFLGFDATGAVVAGAVAAAFGGLLLVGASRRAASFHPTDPNAHLTDYQPDPGPDPAAGSRDDDSVNDGDDRG